MCLCVAICLEQWCASQHATAAQINSAREAANCTPQGANAGELVFVSCRLVAPSLSIQLPEPLKPFFTELTGTSVSWDVEIFQLAEVPHQECSAEIGGGEVCTVIYSYGKSWRTSPLGPDSFKSVETFERLCAGGTCQLPPNVRAGKYHAPSFSAMLLPAMSNASGSGGGVGTSVGFVLDEGLQRQVPDVQLRPNSTKEAEQQLWPGNTNLTASMLRVEGIYLTTAISGVAEVGDIRISLRGRQVPIGGSIAASVAMQMVADTNATASSLGNGASDIARLQPFLPSGGAAAPWGAWGPAAPLEVLKIGSYTRSSLADAVIGVSTALIVIGRCAALLGMVLSVRAIIRATELARGFLRVTDCCTCHFGSTLDHLLQKCPCLMSIGVALFLEATAACLTWLDADTSTSAIAGGTALLIATIFGVLSCSRRSSDKEDAPTGYRKLGGGGKHTQNRGRCPFTAV